MINGFNYGNSETTAQTGGSDNSKWKKLNNKVCKLGQIHGRVSPLCNDYKQYDMIESIAIKHDLDLEVMIGISYSESHIGTNFAPNYDCSKMNNWGGIKAQKNDDGTYDKYKLPYKGCWLYPFKDMEAYRNSLANTLDSGYKQRGCDNIVCLSKYYVGSPGTPKQGRINRVSYFIKYK